MYIDKYLTEKDLLTDLVYSQRQIWNTYDCALIESSCQDLKEILLKCQLNILQNQSSISKAMEIRGWSAVNPASENKIESFIH